MSVVDHYNEAVAADAASAGSEHVQRVLSACQDMEMTTALKHADTAQVQTQHILASLRIGDLENAKFIWGRTHDDVKAVDRALKACWPLTKALLQRDFPAFFATAASVVWPAATQSSVAKLIDTVRGRVMAMLAKAYSSFPAAELAPSIGLPAAEAVAYASSLGWTAHPDTEGILCPPPPVASSSKALSGLPSIELLSGFVLALERKVAVSDEPAS